MTGVIENLLLIGLVCGQLPSPAPLVRAVDLNVGEAAMVELCDGAKAEVKLLGIEESRDEIRSAIREARVRVQVNGEALTLVSANYRLPVAFAGVQIDCPITQGYVSGSKIDNPWGLLKEARLRLWPARSPWAPRGSFAYPVRQRWFASDTQMANEPTFVDGGEFIGARQKGKIYYHYGLDIGGAEGLIDVLAAVDGMVAAVGADVHPDHRDLPMKPEWYSLVLVDARGTYYGYAHLDRIDPRLRPGREVEIGQPIAVLSKLGMSGGWSHLHFDIHCRQPSGRWGIQEGYAFLWEAYRRQYDPKLIAVARPHRLARVGEKVALDGSRSFGEIARFHWTFSDGAMASGAKVERTYERPGTYSEILKIADREGREEYDFAVVQVMDSTGAAPPALHAAYAPTQRIKPHDEVTFHVRSFHTQHGGETLDFGDGSARASLKSDGNAQPHNPRGYAVATHRYEKPGDYIVKAEHASANGHKAIAHLHVRVEE